MWAEFIDTLRAQLSNQVVAGAVALGLVGVVAASLRNLPGALWAQAKRAFIVTATLDSRNDLFTAFVAWSPARQLGVAVFASSGEPWAAGAGFRALSTFLSISENWRPPAGPAHPPSAYTGVYVDDVGSLGRLRVSLEAEDLVIDYLDGPPPLLPANFRFVFERGAPRARYVVTPVGVGRRSAD